MWTDAFRTPAPPPPDPAPVVRAGDLVVIVPGVDGAPDVRVPLRVVLPGIEARMAAGRALHDMVGRVPFAALDPETQAVALAASQVQLYVPDLPGWLADRLDVDDLLLVRLAQQVRLWAVQRLAGTPSQDTGAPQPQRPAGAPAPSQTPESVADALACLRGNSGPPTAMSVEPAAALPEGV